jgi:hypothetical protein
MWDLAVCLTMYHMARGVSGLREPATGVSSVKADGDEIKETAPDGGVGRQGKDGLEVLPKDALAK